MEGKKYGGILNSDYRSQDNLPKIHVQVLPNGNNEKTRRTEGYHKLSVDCYQKG